MIVRLYTLAASQVVWTLAAFTLGSLAIGTGADARTVQIPETLPKVLLDVPDDWIVAPKDGSFELRSPDKTSIIIVGIVKRTKPDVIAWNKMATAKMVEFGVKFDPKSAAPPPPKSDDAKQAKAAPKPDLARLGIAAPTAGRTDAPVFANAGTTTSALPTSALPTTVFSGAPSTSVPEQAPTVPIARDEQPEPAFLLDQFSGPATSKPNGQMMSKIAFLYGATLDGKPVDAQFFNFGLSKDSAFLLQQESMPSDNRAVDIAKSVRRAP